MTRLVTLLLLCLALSPAVTLAEGDPVKGRQKAAACVSCHNENGISTSPNIPHLAGQYPRYIIQQWVEFNEGRHKDEFMKGVSSMLNRPEDIADIAAYYSQLPRHKGRGKTTDAKVTRAKLVFNGIVNCYQCHGENGEGSRQPRFDVPLLAGQNKAYLIKAMKAFRDRSRTSTQYTMMNDVMNFVTDEDMDAVADYLSNL